VLPPQSGHAADAGSVFPDWCIAHGSPLAEAIGAVNAGSGASAITSIRKQFVSVLGIIVIVGVVSGNPDAYRPSCGFR